MTPANRAHVLQQYMGSSYKSVGELCSCWKFESTIRGSVTLWSWQHAQARGCRPGQGALRGEGTWGEKGAWSRKLDRAHRVQRGAFSARPNEHPPQMQPPAGGGRPPRNSDGLGGSAITQNGEGGLNTASHALLACSCTHLQASAGLARNPNFNRRRRSWPAGRPASPAGWCGQEHHNNHSAVTFNIPAPLPPLKDFVNPFGTCSDPPTRRPSLPRARSRPGSAHSHVLVQLTPEQVALRWEDDRAPVQTAFLIFSEPAPRVPTTHFCDL